MFMKEDLPEVILLVIYELISMVDERFRGLGYELEAIRPCAHEIAIMEFDAFGDPRFIEKMDPIVSVHWITDVESAFLANICPPEAKINFSACLLRDGLTDWWRVVCRVLEPDADESITWEDFISRFRKEFGPIIEV
ncbi:unnamed protein product [Lactuca virosa]|uniref:Retrotransposon gag domain-containing protein n=1 Tax=Lactuca virosa TaxID=75947 RepID=A0AAU9PJJ1_9ASTR|nr:unnamed protein product [Lactuca virosa]